MKNERLIRAEIEKELSFLDGRPSLHDSIMQEIRGEKAVKKKLSVSLVFALVIMAISAVALAYTLSRQYFEDVAQLQFDSGYYDDWGWQEKQKMVEILQKYGLISGEEAGNMKTEKDVDAYMIERYGFEGRSDVIGLWSIRAAERPNVR